MDVFQSAVLQIEVISTSYVLCIDRIETGFVSWLYFPTLMPTQVAFIFMLLSPVRWEEKGSKRGEGYLFFLLFLSLSE